MQTRALQTAGPQQAETHHAGKHHTPVPEREQRRGFAWQQGAGKSPAPPGNPSLNGFKFGQISLLPAAPVQVQTKLTVNAPGDRYEQEADAMAEKVVRMGEYSPPVSPPADAPANTRQRKCAHCEEEDKKKEKKTDIMRKAEGSGGFDASPSLFNGLQASKGGGFALPGHVRAPLENTFGADFSGVRIHTDDRAVAMNSSIQARAFTHGHDIYFSRGAYSPGSTEGARLLAHELTHVLQQGEGRAPFTQVQRKGGTFGGFFRNIGRSIWDIFGDEKEYDDKTLQDYLAVLDAGQIEDDYDSDDKARAVVRWWKAGKIELSPERKVLLIKEMMSGVTGDADENAILDILEGSMGEMMYISNKIKLDLLRDEFHGEESDKLEKILKPFEKRVTENKPKDANETTSVKRSLKDISGDGTPTNKGITVGAFHTYMLEQVDWFTEKSIKDDDAGREALWEIVDFLQTGPHVVEALTNIKIADLKNGLSTEKNALLSFAEGAKSDAKTVRINNPLEDFDKVVRLGKTMKALQGFVPWPVLRIVIDQETLEKIESEGLLEEFRKYYAEFSPTIENPGERPYILELLREKIDPYMPLKGWMHDLHIISKKARLRLLQNIQKKDLPKAKRTKPVLLILMSGLDWNAAFLRGDNLESAILNTKNLALLLQGEAAIKDITTKVNDIADKYGQIPSAGAKGRLGQVVIAGHGQATSVEQATTGQKMYSNNDQSVYFEGEDLNPATAGDDSEKLIDTILSRMDPKQARVVFAGCLVGSHSVPIEAKLADTQKAAAEINDSIKKNPNLRDLVIKRMEALGIVGEVQAANASTTFDAFSLDRRGQARLALTWDPDVGGSKDKYVKTGSEPEGALRAALETWADPKFGPTWTTDAMRDFVKTNSAVKEWWKSLTRTAYELALPATGDVKPALINDLSHRVESWLLAGWPDTIKVDTLNADVKAGEASKLFSAMLVSDRKNHPHLKVGVYQVWMQTDATKTADFITAIESTTLVGTALHPLLSTSLIEPQLPKLLLTPDPAKPTPGQMKLAVSLAMKEGEHMPEAVKTFLKSAAGNTITSNFPAALHVGTYLDGDSEIGLLKLIGLAPGSDIPDADAKDGNTKQKQKANADLNQDKTNETYISFQPRKYILTYDAPVWEKPDVNAPIISTIKKGKAVRVVGKTGNWTAIDFDGKLGFIELVYVP